MKADPKPRIGRAYGYGMPISGHYMGDTWLEDESWTYPSGGMHRRARVRIIPNASYPAHPAVPVDALRVVQCGIPDTFWTIPARLTYRGSTIRGFVSVDESRDEYTFTPYAN